MSLTDADKAAGWVEWHGGECPVSPDTMVEVRLRDGTELSIAPAKVWDWEHFPQYTCDIIAYRVADQRAAAVGASSHEAAIGSSATNDQTAAHPLAPTPKFDAMFSRHQAESALLLPEMGLEVYREHAIRQTDELIEFACTLERENATLRRELQEAQEQADAHYDRAEDAQKKAESERDDAYAIVHDANRKRVEAEDALAALQRRLDAPVEEVEAVTFEILSNLQSGTEKVVRADYARDLYRKWREAQAALDVARKDAERWQQVLNCAYTDEDAYGNQYIVVPKHPHEGVDVKREFTAIIDAALAVGKKP